MGTAIEGRGIKSASSGGLSVNLRAWKREMDTAAVQLEANEDIYVTTYARSDMPEGREDARTAYQVDLDLALDMGHITWHFTLLFVLRRTAASENRRPIQAAGIFFELKSRVCFVLSHY